MPIIENTAMLIIDDIMLKLKEYEKIRNILEEMHVDSYCGMKENLEQAVIPHLEEIRDIYSKRNE